MPGLLGDGENVGFGDAARIDRSARPTDRRQRRDAVAQARRLLESQRLGRLAHLLSHAFAHRAAPARQEIARLLDEGLTSSQIDFMGARTGAARLI